jgi:hypothetical protein
MSSDLDKFNEDLPIHLRFEKYSSCPAMHSEDKRAILVRSHNLASYWSNLVYAGQSGTSSQLGNLASDYESGNPAAFNINTSTFDLDVGLKIHFRSSLRLVDSSRH